MIENLSAYIPAFKGKAAIENSIKEFFHFYPDGDVYIVSDGGEDFSYLSSDKITTRFESKNIGYPHKVDENGNQIRHGWYKDEALEFLLRVKNGFESLKTDYVILMEEDVILNGKLTLKTPFADSGYCKNPIEGSILSYIQEHNGNIGKGMYGAGGGSVFNRKIFLESFDKGYNLLLNDFDMLFDLQVVVGWPDFLMDFIYMIGGHAPTFNIDIFELPRNFVNQYRQFKHPIIHKFNNYRE